MRVIEDKNEYPNMLPKEIVNSGVALSGDALTCFMESCSEQEYKCSKDDVDTIINDAIYELERIRDLL